MKDETRLVHIKHRRSGTATVNPAIERASTVLRPDRASLYGPGENYGRMGLSVQRELENAVCILENAQYCRLTANGLQACALATASVVTSGDHVLASDGIYGPNRRFSERRLTAMGVTCTRFRPTLAISDLEKLIQPNTKAIILESPSSLTFELADTPAIVALAKAHNLITIFDNTWGVGLLHRPLDFGVDLVVQALTKYPVGHADAMGGAVLSNNRHLAQQVAACSEDWGISQSPDDAYVSLRGLRTLATRLKQHEKSAYIVAKWLAQHRRIDRVLHPGLPSHPQHDLWQRDFSGACGLFGAIMAPTAEDELDRFLEAMTVFGMGFSWGGYESLLIPCDDQLNRLPDDPIHARSGPLLRLHIGLENPEDLIADLDQALSFID